MNTSNVRQNRTNIIAALGIAILAVAIAPSLAQEDLKPFIAAETLPPGQPEEFSPGDHALPPPFTAEMAAAPAGDSSWYHIDGKVRAYYLNDQRIEFTGNEATFGAEGVLQGGLHQRLDFWEVSAEAQLFINQPFDRNILRDSAWRASYIRNFDIDPFEISQLYLAARHEDLYFSMGRFETPFGRYYFPNYLNSFQDSPFIRSESILFRETGFVAQWDPEPYVLTMALTNGGPDKDTNSSKALVARAGIDREWFACGASVKWQDGIGSEDQKQYKNHAGVDAMYAWGNWQLSSEFIYDEYGFRDTTFDPDNIFWGRSVYHRDINGADQRPVHGCGYYFNLGYFGDTWEAHVNYGVFNPQRLGDPVHDAGSRRWLLKGIYHASPLWQLYSTLMLENSVHFGQGGKSRDGQMILAGAQFTF